MSRRMPLPVNGSQPTTAYERFPRRTGAVQTLYRPEQYAALSGKRPREPDHLGTPAANP
jgi:hypothetical protein